MNDNALLEAPETETSAIDVDRTRGNFSYPEQHQFDAGYGLTHDTIDYIVDVKSEPDWIREFRHKALDTFLAKPMPTHWASKDLEAIVFDKIRYYLANAKRPTRSWDEVPEDVKRTFERLGIPEQERKFLAGVEAQFDSEAVYSNIKAAVADQGVIFTGSTEGLIKHPELFKKWFGKVIPTGDNKFSALNSAVFSGGSFIYVPPGVKVKHPLQAYFRINAENFGQFERTLIIADEGSEVMYMEGCTAPKFETATLHSAVVELVAMKGAKIQYVTVQNWSNNVFNLVTKRALAHEEAEVKWIDCNIGSRLTMKYPGVVLKGRKARGEVISIALAGDGQHQDTGAKMIHAADETTSNIVSKSISLGTGRATYRGLVHVPRHLKGCKNNTECDALLINSTSRTDTYPAITVRGTGNACQHEASVSQISEEQIFYMMSRGLTEAQAMSLSVNGFVNDLVREFPMEYSVELKRLIDLEMEGERGLVSTTTEAMGTAITTIKLQNWADIALVAVGKRKRTPRAIEVEALVDIGAVKLYLQKSVIAALGLRPIRTIVSHTMSDRREPRRVFSPVDLELLGRNGTYEVVEIPDTLPNIVGQIPLEDLDCVVDMRHRKLIPNPAHLDGALYDEYAEFPAEGSVG